MSTHIYLSETARRLGISSRTAAGYIHKGLLRASWVGRRWLIDPVSVELLLRSGTPKAHRQSKP